MSGSYSFLALSPLIWLPPDPCAMALAEEAQGAHDHRYAPIIDASRPADQRSLERAVAVIIAALSIPSTDPILLTLIDRHAGDGFNRPFIRHNRPCQKMSPAN